ncbi:protein of unknown function [Candidatus Nitrosocaldus cavascurensis]|uniref:Uncharacterized protein n=1 Tax=Candidatus Nitrosocaldus cavascurensis TaxID=2058097 RepID=A0A2K5ARM3_9ARCH|nr:protein of unknown function [Candidatus Nitrosocaldus cavascurensis]
MNRTIVGLKVTRIILYVTFTIKFESNYSRIERTRLLVLLLKLLRTFESNYSRIESLLAVKVVDPVALSLNRTIVGLKAY